MKGGSVSGVCKGYITKVVWRAILALMGAWGPHKLVISYRRPRVDLQLYMVLNLVT